MSQIKLLITDFDGTLVDTFEANQLLSVVCLWISIVGKRGQD